MKTYIKIVLATLLSIAIVAPIEAQTARSAYFLEGVPTTHKLNPVLSGEYGYVSFPLLGNVNFSVTSNVGVSSFLFPSENGGLLSFLSSGVDSKEFLDNLNSKNKMLVNFDIDVLSFGFHKWNGFNTFNLSVRSNQGTQLPKELFEFVKVGRQSVTEPTTYKIRGINVNTSSYAELAFGHSRKINEQWSVGAKVKGLIGLAYANIDIAQMDVTMDNVTSQWLINTKAIGNFAAKGLEVKTKTEIDSNGEPYDVVSEVDFNTSQIGVSGGGLAFDMGVAYRPIDNLEITASLNDLGFMVWNHNKSIESISSGVEFDGVDMGDGEEFEDLGSIFTEMVEFKEVEKPKTSSFLNASLNIGAEYSFLNNAISLGILSHTRFGTEVYTEGMLAVNFRAKKAFMMSLNGTLSNMGNSFGAVLSVCPKGFNLFLAVDCYPAMKLAPEYYLPINKFRLNATLGLNFTFGKRHQWGI